MTRPLHKWTSAEIADYARRAEHLTPEDVMKMETRQYWPDHEAPDFGGLDGRFANLRAERNTRLMKYERALHTALMITGTLAGVGFAILVAM